MSTIHSYAWLWYTTVIHCDTPDSIICNSYVWLIHIYYCDTLLSYTVIHMVQSYVIHMYDSFICVTVMHYCLILSYIGFNHMYDCDTLWHSAFNVIVKGGGERVKGGKKSQSCVDMWKCLSKEPYILSKELYILSKEPYILSKELYTQKVCCSLLQCIAMYCSVL